LRTCLEKGKRKGVYLGGGVGNVKVPFLRPKRGRRGGVARAIWGMGEGSTLFKGTASSYLSRTISKGTLRSGGGRAKGEPPTKAGETIKDPSKPLDRKN